MDTIQAPSKREKKILRPQNQQKLRSYRTTPKCKFGYQIPLSNDYEHALSIDEHDDDNKWAESIKLDIDQKNDHDNYKGMGKGSHSEG